MRNDPSEADEIIQSTLLNLGEKHFYYGATTNLMELVGDIFRAGFMQVIPQDGMEPGKHELIRHAFSAFLGVIVYWLQSGFRYVESGDHKRTKKTF